MSDAAAIAGRGRASAGPGWRGTLPLLGAGAIALGGVGLSIGDDSILPFGFAIGAIAALALAYLVWVTDVGIVFCAALVLSVFGGQWSYVAWPDAIPITPDRLLLAGALFALVVGAPGARDRGRFEFRPVHLLLLATLAFAIASAIAAGTLFDNSAFFRLFDRFGIAPFVAFFLAPVIFHTKARRHILLVALVGLGAYLGVTAFVETVGPKALVLPPYILDPDLGYHPGRARGPFLEAEANGLALFGCGVAAAIAFSKWRPGWPRLAAGAVVLLCALGCLFTLQRAIWLGATLGLVAALIAMPSRRRFAVPVFGGLVAAVLAALLVIPGLQDAASTRASDERSLWDRANLNNAAVNMVEAQPLIGHGWGRFASESPPYFLRQGDIPLTGVGPEPCTSLRLGLNEGAPCTQVAHNVYLSIGSELGLVGLSLWIACYVVAIGGALRLRAGPDLEPWRIGLIGMAVMWLVVAYFTPLEGPFFPVLLWVWAGMLFVPETSARPKRRHPQQPTPALAAPAPVVEPRAEEAPVVATADPTGRALVGVAPAEVLERAGDLFDALEEVLPVRFGGAVDRRIDELDGVLVFGEGADAWRDKVPCFAAPDAKHEEVAKGDHAPVSFTESSYLEACLRGAVLLDFRAGQAEPVEVDGDAEVLASGPNGPVWTREEVDGVPSHTVALSPLAGQNDDPLRAQLRPGRFLSLLPLIAFLREASAAFAWHEPPLRASFIIDDPNLHRARYGFVDYEVLAAHSRLHGYHVGIATVPIDGWRVDRAAASIFRNNADHLSLLVHGSEHSRHELAELASQEHADNVLGSAARRIAELEERGDLEVGRVMVAPHERCSVIATGAMLRTGFDALAIDRANPWRFRPFAEQRTAGISLAELVSGGFPVMRREYLGTAGEDLVLRAFLRQPLLLYGHHEDFEKDLSPLAEAAERINAFGAVSWMSVKDISESNVLTREADGVLTARLFTRRARVTVSPGTEALRVEFPHVDGSEGIGVAIGETEVAVEAQGGWRVSPAVDVAPGEVEVRIVAPPGSQAPMPEAAPPALGTVARRLASEGRDRSLPLLKRMRRPGGSS